jgi:leader peptidase (prepilin peptidase) / N-methyltransferase
LLALLLIFATLFGLAVGSFLNVAIYRLPRGESLAYPGSHCPTCGHALNALDNIPLISWFWQRGKCRYCGAAIAVRYPLVEMLCGALFALSVAQFGVTPAALAACVFGALLIVIAFIDLDHLLVLDPTTIAGALIGVAFAIATHRLLGALEGAAVGVGVFGAIYLLTGRMGMGLGDVKLAGMLGAYLGYPAMLVTSVASFIIGALLAIPVLAGRRRARRDALPFGPFLVMAALLAMFAPAVLSGPYEAYRSLLTAHWLGR